MLPNLERAKSLLQRDGVDLALIPSPLKVRYLSQLKSRIRNIVGSCNALTIVLFPVSKDAKPVLVANVTDSPAILKQKESPHELEFHRKFMLNFGSKLDSARIDENRRSRQSPLSHDD